MVSGINTCYLLHFAKLCNRIASTYYIIRYRVYQSIVIIFDCFFYRYTFI